MEFNIRAIALVPSIPADARIVIGELFGKVVDFREGVRYSVTLPDGASHFAGLTDPEKILTALSGWARVFRHPDEGGETIHVIAPADNEDGDLVFYRVDMRHPPQPRRGPRPPVAITGTSVMSYEDCASWLVELAHLYAMRSDQRQLQLALSRPCPVNVSRLRLAWVGPEFLDGRQMARRISAIGRVYGADILHIVPRSYRDVASRLAGSMPLDAVIICGYFAPYIGAEVVPGRVRADLVHLCDSRTAGELEQQISVWLEICYQELEKARGNAAVDEHTLLLATMLRGMLSHSKIGQFNHCQKETVLKGVRARRLNVTFAESILDENSEAHHDTRDSEALFLWKEHHDGRQYFLNARRIEAIKLMIIAG